MWSFGELEKGTPSSRYCGKKHPDIWTDPHPSLLLSPQALGAISLAECQLTLMSVSPLSSVTDLMFFKVVTSLFSPSCLTTAYKEQRDAM
jgi:hypothetical protein